MAKVQRIPVCNECRAPGTWIVFQIRELELYHYEIDDVATVFCDKHGSPDGKHHDTDEDLKPLDFY